MSLRPAVMRRLMKELIQLRNEPPEGIRVVMPEDNMLDITGIIEGPAGTPYEGGYFRVRFGFTEDFPNSPPKCWFSTKIFHPNVSSTGEICVNTLKKDWQPSYGIGHILVTVKCLLIYPNPESALHEEAGKLLLENYEDYCERARLITSVHATPKVRPVEFNTPDGSCCASSSSTSTPAPKASKISPVEDTVPAIVIPQENFSSANTVSPNTTTFRKSSSPVPQPLQLFATNNTSTSPGLLGVVDKDGNNVIVKSLSSDPSTNNTANPTLPTQMTIPMPLGTADANSPTLGGSKLASAMGGKVDTGPGASNNANANGLNGAVKSMKRPAGSMVGEKRKKALKRL